MFLFPGNSLTPSSRRIPTRHDDDVVEKRKNVPRVGRYVRLVYYSTAYLQGQSVDTLQDR